MNAARNGVNQLPANTGQSWGNTSQTISSKRSVGVARKNQLYRKTRTRTARNRLVRPSARGNAITHAAPREELRDRQLAGVLRLLVTAFGVLCQHGVGTADQQLRDRVGVAGIALQVHLRLARRLELIVQRLQVHLVLRSGLNRDILPGEV